LLPGTTATSSREFGSIARLAWIRGRNPVSIEILFGRGFAWKKATSGFLAQAAESARPPHRGAVSRWA